MYLTDVKEPVCNCAACDHFVIRVGNDRCYEYCERFYDYIPPIRKITEVWCHAFRPREEKEKAYVKD